MAVYKIFAEKDASIYSYYPEKNAGLDEVLDLSMYESTDDTYESSRILIKFPTDQIVDVIKNKVSGSTYDAYLRLFLANASDIPIDYTIVAAPVSESWDMGTGRVGNIPETVNGVSWLNRTQNLLWNTTALSAGVSSSYSGSNEGGGNWYGVINTTSSYATQSFTYVTPKDIEIKTTHIVKAHYNNEEMLFAAYKAPNNGFILKHSGSLEFYSGSAFELKYFSTDTHTIYPPCLEIRWDDSTFNTGSNSIISTDDLVVTIQNNKEIYKEDSVHRFRLGVRKRFPTRTFQTSSLYTNNSLLPATSYWSIKDHKTEDTIVDFDDNYTKISADGTNNYFDVYMNGLQPERYYRLVLKVVMGTRVLILDDNYIFKIIR